MFLNLIIATLQMCLRTIQTTSVQNLYDFKTHEYKLLLAQESGVDLENKSYMHNMIM